MLSSAIEKKNSRPIKPYQRFEGHSNLVRGVIHLRGGQQIMTCSGDGSLRVWNLQIGKHVANLQDGESGVYSIALSVDGKKVVSGSGDGIVRLWSIETGKVIARWTGRTRTVSSVCWNQNGVRVLSGSMDGTARVWDVETGKTILQISTGFTNVYTAIFSPDSTLIATGGYTDADAADDKRIKIWDAKTGKLVAILKEHTRSVYCLAWTANGRTLISGSWDCTIRTWDTSTWQQLTVLTGHTNIVHGIAISLNGHILASASWDYTARLWNLESGQPIGSPLYHPHCVNGVSFSTDGTLLATGCDGDNAYTWDITAIMKEARLEELLDVDKSFLLANATRRLVQQPTSTRRLDPGFFAHSSHIASSPSHCDTPTRPIILRWPWLNFFKRPQRYDNESIQLVLPLVADVPLTYGQPRNISAAQERARQKREKENAKQAKLAKKLKNLKNDATSSQLHSPGNITQPADQSHVQPSSGPHLAASSTIPANAISAPVTTPATPAPDTTTPHAGCLTCFLLHIGCVSMPRHN